MPNATFAGLCFLGSVALCAFWSSAVAQVAGPASSDGLEISGQLPKTGTEHLFAFIEGSDMGEKGEVEGEIETESEIARRFGSYAATSSGMHPKFYMTDNFAIAPTALFSYHDISGQPDMTNRRQFDFQGLGVEFRYRLIDRTAAPFGLTVVVDPHWGRVDDASGENVVRYGADLKALLDRELIKDSVFAAVNLSYEPGWTKPRTTGVWERESMIWVGAAVAYQVAPGVFPGLGTRYFRAYEGTALNKFAGDALFIGPAICLVLSDRLNVSVAWNIQIAGNAVGESGSPDLVNFTRHQVFGRLAMSF